MAGTTQWLNNAGATLAVAGFVVYAAAFIGGIFARRVRKQPFTKWPLSFRIRVVALGVVFLGALLEIAARL